MSSKNNLTFIKFRRIIALVFAVPMTLLATWLFISFPSDIAIVTFIAAVGFIVSFIADGKLLNNDLSRSTKVWQLIALQALGSIVGSAVIIYAWSNASTWVCLSGCTATEIAQVNIQALILMLILSTVAALIFLAPSLSVLRQMNQ